MYLFASNMLLCTKLLWSMELALGKTECAAFLDREMFLLFSRLTYVEFGDQLAEVCQ